MGRKTLWVIGNHLLFTSRIWENIERDTIILMVESEERARFFRYHKKKLVLVFSAMRHYAEELRESGWAVDYVRLAEGCDFYRVLKRHVERYHPEEILVLRPADVSIVGNIGELFGKLGVPFRFVPNDLFLVDPAEFAFRVAGKKRLLMEQHYRFLRRRLQILLDYEGKPEGGRWNYDVENRRPYSPEVRPGYIPMFTPDALTQAVMEEVEKIFPDHPGSVRGFDYPVTRKEALEHLARFVEERLDLFGPYQDMMATAEPHLYHSLLSPMLNIGLLHPREVVEQVVGAYRQGRVRLASVEAMVRQVIGWREFVYGISQSFLPRYLESNYFDTHRSLPRFFWDGQTDLRCLREVITQTLELGYAHHIQRLMVLANFCTLVGVEPKLVYRWFMEMYVDAYEWVMAPNILGMGTFADGGLVATKPYVASGAYINRMSDYCKKCRYDVKKRVGQAACPFNYLYWDFLLRNRERLGWLPRLRMAYRQLATKTNREITQIRNDAERFSNIL